MQLLALQVIILSTLGFSRADTHYVKTTASPPSSCPGQPCLTLHQYTQQNNFTTGTTFLFLPGNHSLQRSTLTLTSVANITFRGEDSDSTVNIICTDVLAILCEKVTSFNIEGLTFILDYTEPENVEEQVSAVKLIDCDNVSIFNTRFQGSGAATNTGRPLHLEHTKATIKRSKFENNSARKGGAILAQNETSLNISGSTFTRNRATGGGGGAIHVYYSTLLLDGLTLNQFSLNSATAEGGAVDCYHSSLEMRGNNTFQNNSCSGNQSCDGGALALNVAKANITSGTVLFSHNAAFTRGGAIFIILTEAHFTGNITLLQNTAHYGGGICIERKSVITSTNIIMIGNSAQNEGGALYIASSNITFSGITNITKNTANVGGGISALDTVTTFKGNTSLSSNNASKGGALSYLHGKISFHNSSILALNTADKGGGAVYAMGTAIYVKDWVNFTLNTALDGGAMYLGTGASLHLLTHECNQTQLSTLSNSARQYGGAIYYKDSATTTQCNYQKNTSTYYKKLPQCFLRTWLDPSKISHNNCSLIRSSNDSAEVEGSFLYGGLLGRCRIIESYYLTYKYTGATVYTQHGFINAKFQEKAISSKPYGLCICNNTSISDDCIRSRSLQVYRGQKFTVPLLAMAQVGTTSTRVAAITGPEAAFKISQTSQPLPDSCHTLSYTLYSPYNYEEVVLYPDGPCRDTGSARVVISVTLLPCPDGFTQSDESCICEKRLHQYAISCNIDEIPYFNKTADSNFWMGVLYTNTTYEGLVLGKSCPMKYCKTDSVRITLDNPDIQCDLHRSGLLCGACATNHSLMLDGSKCEICPNTYLVLLLPFAAAGIVLVAFLTLLRLTVAMGTLNSVILYANIVQVNRKVFFPVNTRNVLTVFLAWMNLDLGFQTCFYDGLDAYVLTWLQFVFPVYIWVLMGLIIFISRYSITVSKLIGSNPIAVLATLLVMSYAKILRIIIEVYSSVKLDYPDNKTVTVWLKDANVPFLQSKHLVLTVVTSLVLIFLFLPYTFLLLLGHKLYRFTGRKYFRWLNRIKPLLDSYYAPYKIHTRYWTGLLLLIRCALYIVFSFNSLGGTPWSLLAIIITFTAVVILAWLSVRIYKEFYVNLIEASIYLNLIVLSAATATKLNASNPALVYTAVGTVFVTMTGIIVYHSFIIYIAKSAVWRRAKTKIIGALQTLKSPGADKLVTLPLENASPGTSSHDPHKIVSKTVIDLREPLLESL